MSGIKEFLRPRSVREAVVLLNGSSGRVALAGGTFLGSHCPVQVSGLVDLSLLGLSYVKAQGAGIEIGAMTTLADVAESRLCGAMAEHVRDAATEPLRHMITVGGNVMIPLRWSDLPLLLCVLDARFVVEGIRGVKEYSADEFFAQAPVKVVGRGKILTAVRIPRARKMRVARIKLVRNFGDVPGLQIAIAMQMQRDVLRNVRIAYVGQRPLPTRLRQCEALVEGMRAAEVTTAEIGRVATEEVGQVTDVRFSSEYLREMVGVFVQRALEECIHG